MAEVKRYIAGNALLYEIDVFKKLIVDKYVKGFSYIKETALFISII
jgi:hypothetical protein